MRFHILGLPHTISAREYVACAFTQKIVRLCAMLHGRGHEVIHYGHEWSRVECTEHVPVIEEHDIETCYGVRDWRVVGPPNTFNNGDSVHLKFNDRAASEIAKRKQPSDFLLCMWGSGHKQCADKHPDMIVVEPGIGYGDGYFAPYKVFESYALLHAYFGLHGVKTAANNRWYDVVIPNYFDLDDFEYREEKGDYFLFMGRLNEGKGIHIAVQIVEEIGGKLIVAGPGQFSCESRKRLNISEHVGYVGVADYERRRELLAGAKAVICPSTFIEPFNGVHVEAMLCFPAWTNITARNVEAVGSRPYNGPLFKIETAKGNTIECTSDHPIWTQRGWVKAKDVTTNDSIATAEYNKHDPYVFTGRIADVVSRLRRLGCTRDRTHHGPFARERSNESLQAWSANHPKKQGDILSGDALADRIGLLGRPYRWRGHDFDEAHRRFGACPPATAYSYSVQQFSHYDGVATIQDQYAEFISEMPEDWQRVFRRFEELHVGVFDSRDELFAPISSIASIPRIEASEYGNCYRMDGASAGAGEMFYAHASSGRTIFDATVYEFTSVTRTSYREVTNLPVYDLGTSSGAYEAEGLLVHNSGTPVITTDFGAFSEYNLQGVTGFRCRTFRQFVEAARNIGQIAPQRCREWAAGMFDMHRVAFKYEDYFRTLLDLRTPEGWYQLN